MINPKRGEIWLVDLEPTKGQEIQKVRPAIVISDETLQELLSCLIVCVDYELSD